MKVAIIGGGPRGLWATEQLDYWARACGTSLQVHIWDPHDPGPGWTYRAEQPEYWQINVSSSVIRTRLGSFNRWRAERFPNDSGDPFPPRRMVGQFLRATWDSLITDPSSPLEIAHRRDRAKRVEPARDRHKWAVDGEIYDEVLLATGHEHTWHGGLLELFPRSPTPIYRAFDPSLLKDIASGSTVLVRGAALTFIDVSLALTVGRGGSFNYDTAVSTAPAGYSRMRYLPSGEEPARIIPVSRSGHFQCVKPDPSGPLVDPLRHARMASYRTAALSVDDLDSLERVVAEAADAILSVQLGTDVQKSWSLIAGTANNSSDPVDELRHSFAVSTGHAPADAPWAIGEAWRLLYPAIIERASYENRSTLRGFDGLARRMERFAFGPTPKSASQLITLIDAEVIDCSHLCDIAALHANLNRTARTKAHRRPVRADAVIDAVLPPAGLLPGTLAHSLLSREANAPSRTVACVDRKASTTVPHLAIVGRATEGVTTGNDTLNRNMHAEIDAWARHIVSTAAAKKLDRGAHGAPRLTARLEPWMTTLLMDRQRCTELVTTYGSPVNVHHTARMAINSTELVHAGRQLDIEVRVFFARKANKSLAFVDAAHAAGHGIDVASQRELQQVLDRGIRGRQVILSAAVKPDALLALAISREVRISVDSKAELERISALATRSGMTALVAPRLAPDPKILPPTRFGETKANWIDTLRFGTFPGVLVEGIHIHLHGYSAKDRAYAAAEAIELADRLAAVGHRISFIDLGGGVPMSYLADSNEWDHFLNTLEQAEAGASAPFTWNGAPLRNFYPFWQTPTRGAWLTNILRESVTVNQQQRPVATHLRTRGLRLHLEPGRALLDGCGLTLAQVAFTKHRSDGIPLIGLDMNRTQCRTTSDDMLVDPIRVPAPGAPRGKPAQGFLVGAYCIEDEIIIKRRLHFPNGIHPGDVVAFPNSAGYFMHILESASHQIPLAKNVIFDSATGAIELDDIDTIEKRNRSS